ncbi:enhancing factor [Ligilactobacillus equi DPC 6820]|uniref:Enhancing factor n=2 Tax=Ligilactobacillus equi TaxID=137357 RepID=V7HSW9_9LACO|nr:enhancing factor [Ligilactobacillus equi DPC 6820]
MPIVEIFNNVYGTLYQAKYIYPTNEEFTKSAWIYGRNRERAVERMVNAVENGKGYQGAEYSTRLLMLMNLADYHDNGGQDFRAFNQYHQELVAQGKPDNDLGKDWVELFLNQYGINLVDYFDNLGVKLDSSTRLNALQSNKAVAVMLYQVVGENDLPQAMDALGWTDKQLKNKTSLITTADLAKLDLKADTTLSLANYQVLAGKQLAIMDGDRVVRTINGDDLIANQGSVALSQVPVGGYTLKVLDNALQVADPYITIKSGMPNQLQTAVTTTLLPEVEALYTDSSHTTVKPSLTQAQLEAAQSLVDRIENPAIKQLNQALITQAQPDVEEITLKGYGNQTFATINKNEGSDKLVLQTLSGKPQPFYGMNDYVTVEVFDDNGKLLYQRSFKGNEDLVASSIEIPVQEYYQVKVSHKEGASRLVTKLDDQVVIPEKVSSFTVVDGHLMADNTLFIQDGLRGKTPQFEVGELTQPSDLIKKIKARVNDANGKTYTNANFTVENLDVNTPGSYTVKVKAEVVINGMKRTVEQAYPVVITGIASSEESESDTNPSASSIESVPSQSPTLSPSESSGEVPSETSAESVPSETTTSEPSEASDVTPSETMPESVASETTTSGPSEPSDVTPSETMPESVPSESPTSGLNESSEEVPSETTSESVPSESPTSEPSEPSDVTPSETTPESGPSETTTSEPSESIEEVPSETTSESVPSKTTTSGPSEPSDVTPSETTPESVASETTTSGPSEPSDVTPSETMPESDPSETTTSGPSESSEEVPSETTSESVPSEPSTSGPSEPSDVTPSETLGESDPSETTTSGPSEALEEVPSETTSESVASETTTSEPSESSNVTPSETMPESVASETTTSGPSEPSDVTPSETMPESGPSETTTSEPSESSDVTLSETTPESVPSESPTSGLNESSEEVPSETTVESGPSETTTSDPSEPSEVVPSKTMLESGSSETTTSEPSESSEVVPSETLGESVASETTTSGSSEALEVVPSETLGESVASETTTSGPSETSDVTPSETLGESVASETTTSGSIESSEVVPSETTSESGSSETTTSGPSEPSEEVPSEITADSVPSETSTTPAPSANLSESSPSEVPAPVLSEEFSQAAIESKSGHELLSSDEITETSPSEVSSELSNSGEFLSLGQEDTTVEADIDFEKPSGVLLKSVLNQGSEEGILTGIHSKKGLKKIANGQPSFSASDRKKVVNAKRQLPQLNEKGTSRKLVEVMVVILMLLIFGQNLRKKSRE